MHDLYNNAKWFVAPMLGKWRQKYLKVVDYIMIYGGTTKVPKHVISCFARGKFLESLIEHGVITSDKELIDPPDYLPGIRKMIAESHRDLVKFDLLAIAALFEDYAMEVGVKTVVGLDLDHFLTWVPTKIDESGVRRKKAVMDDGQSLNVDARAMMLADAVRSAWEEEGQMRIVFSDEDFAHLARASAELDGMPHGVYAKTAWSVLRAAGSQITVASLLSAQTMRAVKAMLA